MSNEFINVMIRMNLVGMYGILLILAIRFLLKKISYRYVYMLWLVVFGLLVVPVRFSNGFSLVPKALDQPYVDVRLEEEPAREFTYVEIDSMNNHTMPYRGEFAAPSYTESKPTFPWETVLNILWLVGFLALILWELGRTVRLYRYIHKREIINKSFDGRIVTLKGLDSSFVFGFLRPTIYLSDDMTAEERTYILAHEQYHCKRKDPLIKTLAMLITFIYWYNPIVWLGYHFFCVDMELSCDEAVLKKFSGIIKKDYAASLLKYGALQNRYIISAMTFGQPNLKSRIKNVLNYKRKNVIFTIIALVVVAAVAIGLFSRDTVQEPAFEELTYQPENLVGDWEIDVEMTESKLKETSLFELFGTGFSYGNGLTIADDVMNYYIGIGNQEPANYNCQYEADRIVCTNQEAPDDVLELKVEKSEDKELLLMDLSGETIYWRKREEIIIEEFTEDTAENEIIENPSKEQVLEQLECNIEDDLRWQVDAVRYHGDGYSVLIPKEEWKYSNTVENRKKMDLWNYEGDSKIEFRIISLGTMSEEEAADWLTKHYEEYNLKFDELGMLVGTTRNGQNILNIRIRQFYETSAMAMFYSSDSPQEAEAVMTAMTHSFVFEGPRNRDKEFSYADLSEQEFWLTSGAGGWTTILYVNEDGSFYGTYREGDIGAVYRCEFEGQFSEPVKIDDDTWSAKIESLRQKEEAGKEEIKDGIRHVYSTPYGLEHAEEILFYLPGTSTERFSETFMREVNGSRWGANFNLYMTNCYILHNVNEGYVFSSFPREELAYEESETGEEYPSKIIYEGCYFDEGVYEYWTSMPITESPMIYCEIWISNVTETTFDFLIKEVVMATDERTTVLPLRTAKIVNNGWGAIYEGEEFTLSFEFPDPPNVFPKSIMVDGWEKLEGNTYMNSSIPGHESG